MTKTALLWGDIKRHQNGHYSIALDAKEKGMYLKFSEKPTMESALETMEKLIRQADKDGSTKV